jgi:hypothetical protein
MLEEAVIRRITLARYLFELATINAGSNQDVANAACVNMLQDAIEIFLLAALDHLNANVSARTAFEQYLDKINEVTGDQLPFRRRLLEINKVRVLSKHDGIPPNSREIEGYVSDARKFLEQACRKLLNADFWSISLIRVLDDGEPKKLLLEAEAGLEAGNHAQCLIACRKAFYAVFEHEYDTQKDLNAVLFGSRAPYYARNKEYIERHVKTPFDYIVLDHGQLDADLTKEGLDHTSFWNIWRLTPAVYRHKPEDEWLVKHEPHLLEEDGLKARAAYVLENAVSILLARQKNKQMVKWAQYRVYSARLRREKTTVYTKADKASTVAGITKDGSTIVHVNWATPGLKGDGIYWSAIQATGDGNDDDLRAYLQGFIHEEDLIFD